MASYNKFNDTVQDLGTGVHDLANDQLKVALVTNANAPAATDGQLSDLTEIAYTNLSSRDITTTSWTNTTGTSKLVLADLTLSASGGAVATFRHVIIYNDDATNDELIAYFDYGSDLTLGDGESLILDFDASNGLFTIA
jgi:hypothetical protein